MDVELAGPEFFLDSGPLSHYNGRMKGRHMHHYDRWTLRQLESSDADMEILYPDMYGHPFEQALSWLERQFSSNPGYVDWTKVTYILKVYDFRDYFVAFDEKLTEDTLFTKVMG